MRTKKIFILLGNPDTKSLSGGIADAYEEGALSAGHEVRRQNIGEMQFDPILHAGYKVIQGLEPDLLSFQENVKWCDHFVVVYPNWWSTMPALLKGLIDRAWLPGFAFRFQKTGLLKGYRWYGLLKGKSARIILLANTLPWAAWLLYGDFANELTKAVMWFSGISPVRLAVFSPSEKVSEARANGWKRKATVWGRSAY